MTTYRLGRAHRTYDPRIPHLSALLAGTKPPDLKPAWDWTKNMPPDLGMMKNDTLGDCTCAAFYHAIQVWSFNTGRMVTEPDTDVEKLYILGCGYNPRIPGEGPGGNEQKLLTYLLNHGAPMGPEGAARNRIAAFVEVDPRNTDDIKRTIYECGVCYIGFKVPQFLMPPGSEPPKEWDVRPGDDDTIVGGHAVVLAGYDAQGAKVISWGQYYTMSWAFFQKFVDEAYALADSAWCTSKRTSPGGLSLEELEVQMKALAEA